MNNLLTLIRQQNISEKELAEKLEINRSTVTGLIKGQTHLKDSVILRICKLYGVSADWLLGIESSDVYKCYYTRKKHGWVSGCGWRVNYNKHWAYCPHCGKQIANLNREN